MQQIKPTFLSGLTKDVSFGFITQLPQDLPSTHKYQWLIDRMFGDKSTVARFLCVVVPQAAELKWLTHLHITHSHVPTNCLTWAADTFSYMRLWTPHRSALPVSCQSEVGVDEQLFNVLCSVWSHKQLLSTLAQFHNSLTVNIKIDKIRLDYESEISFIDI